MSAASPEDRESGAAGELSLSEWALRLGDQAGRVLDHPAAFMIPPEVKKLVRELSALVKRLAFEVETLKGESMGKGEILGQMQCPECGASGAEIKLQKGGALLYRWCAGGCNAQFFARNPQQERAMRAAIGGPAPSVTVTDTKPAPKVDEPAPGPAPGKVELPGKLPPKKGTGNAMLDLINGVM